MDHSFRLPDRNCPRCGHNVNGATSLTSQSGAPVAGDVTVCAYCAGVNVYTDRLEIRPATKEDLAEFPEEALNQILLAQIHIREFLKQKDQTP